MAGQGSTVPKWSQLRAIEEAREPLGLKATTIGILRAMLSFMAADRVSELAPDHHIVFASNSAIAQRAHVSIQTVERHITKLVDLKIIQRVAASNGKRWVRRNGAGQVTLVSGLSLLPMADRHTEFTALAAAHSRTQERLNKLRDQCLLALAQVQECVVDNIDELSARVRRILRRRPQEDVLQSLLDEINASISVENSQTDENEPIKLRDRNTKNEGHKENSLNQNSKKENLSEIQLTQDDMERSFPKLCAELRFARSNEDGRRMLDEISQQLRLGPTWWKCKEMGAGISFVLLGYILERVDQVENHSAYMASLIKRLENRDIEIASLLRKPQPKSTSGNS